MILFENNSNVTERLVLELREFKEGAFIRSNTVVDLTASNGWLEKWKQMHGVREERLGGEADEVSTVQAWIERARSIIHKTY